MSSSSLDQLVKGSPPPNVSLPSVAAAAAAASTHTDLPSSTPTPPDPTSLLPSAPEQIYLNLLILEASLRSQYLSLRARRRQNTFVLTILTLWTAYFTYAQYLRPREDGTGVGGSVYWLVDRVEKLALMTGLVMGVLFWATGQWERGVRWPRRWLGVTNRGLRGMNVKAVLLRGPWWYELLGHLSFLLPLSVFYPTPGSSYQFIEYETTTGTHRPQSAAAARYHNIMVAATGMECAEEDIAPGGDHIKLLLLPKHFTPEFRENWDVYRAEYWAKENARRGALRRGLRERERSRARERGSWFWWTGWTGWAKSKGVWTRQKGSAGPAGGLERGGSQRGGGSQRRRMAAASMAPPVAGHHSHHHHHHNVPTVTHSRSSSRSGMGGDAASGGGEETVAGTGTGRERRWSSSTASSVGGEGTLRRKKKVPSSGGTAGNTPDLERRGSGYRARLTPARASSGLSAASISSFGAEDDEGRGVRVKREVVD